MKDVIAPKQKCMKEFICEGCGRDVERKELVIPIGPRAGETIIADMGCKCEDMKLVKQALHQRNEMVMKRIHRVFEGNSLINQSLRTASFKRYHPKNEAQHNAKVAMMNYVKRFDASDCHNVLLVGGYGVGKSHLAVAATKELMQQGKTALFLSVPKLLTKIKQTYNQQSQFSEADILDLIESVDLFVLDDLGTEYTNQRNATDNWTHTKLFEILDSRSGKATIYTTNLRSNALEQKMNERNLSRILDRTQIIPMSGPDHRRKGF